MNVWRALREKHVGAALNHWAMKMILDFTDDLLTYVEAVAGHI